MKFNPADNIQDLHYFEEFDSVNPPISDSSAYTFLSAKTMSDTFEGNAEGCYLYSCHPSPSNNYLEQALSAMEGTEASCVAASGMGAISSTLLQLCANGEHIVCSRTVFDGAYALMKNLAPRMGITTTFVDITKLDLVVAAITKNTKVLYCETMSNPLLEIADISGLAKIAKKHNLKLVVDNTYLPLSVSPAILNADIVIHSLTKYINGSGDTVGGVTCSSREFIHSMRNAYGGTGILLGSEMDSLRSASVLKNLRTLHIRMKQHSYNAMYLAERFENDGLKVIYPGLKKHPSHELFKKMMNTEFGFGGMMSLDLGSLANANALMDLMHEKKVGYLAVSAGFYKTLFSAPGTSTTSEIPLEEQAKIGLSEGLIRFSIGLDNDIERTYQTIKACMVELEIL